MLNKNKKCGGNSFFPHPSLFFYVPGQSSFARAKTKKHTFFQKHFPPKTTMISPIRKIYEYYFFKYVRNQVKIPFTAYILFRNRALLTLRYIKVSSNLYRILRLRLALDRFLNNPLNTHSSPS